jgi:hypothetical protein
VGLGHTASNPEGIVTSSPATVLRGTSYAGKRGLVTAIHSDSVVAPLYAHTGRTGHNTNSDFSFECQAMLCKKPFPHVYGIDAVLQEFAKKGVGVISVEFAAKQAKDLRAFQFEANR